MDFEAPADAWYVWAGVALVSTGLAGVAVGLPTHPPPDANAAANTIDRVAGSPYGASASYDHDASEVRITTKTVGLRNSGGTEHASVRFGSLTPVDAVGDSERREKLSRILYGENPQAVLDGDEEPGDILQWAESARERVDRTGGEWRQADGRLHVRKLKIDGEAVVLVGA